MGEVIRVARPRIAVEEGLRAIREHLAASGYEVVPSAEAADRGVAVLVVSGLHTDVFNQQDVIVPIPVINADGLTPDAVAAEVGRRIAR